MLVERRNTARDSFYEYSVAEYVAITQEINTAFVRSLRLAESQPVGRVIDVFGNNQRVYHYDTVENLINEGRTNHIINVWWYFFLGLVWRSKVIVASNNT